MRYISPIFIILFFIICSATGHAQSEQEDAARFEKIKFLSRQPLDQRLLITLKNNQVIKANFIRTSYAYFVISNKGISQEVQFSDVEKITLPPKRFRLLKRIARIPLYAVEIAVSVPGAAIFYLGATIDQLINGKE
jgi:hypothetical protein